MVGWPGPACHCFCRVGAQSRPIHSHGAYGCFPAVTVAVAAVAALNTWDKALHRKKSLASGLDLGRWLLGSSC